MLLDICCSLGFQVKGMIDFTIYNFSSLGERETVPLESCFETMATNKSIKKFLWIFLIVPSEVIAVLANFGSMALLYNQPVEKRREDSGCFMRLLFRIVLIPIINSITIAVLTDQDQRYKCRYSRNYLDIGTKRIKYFLWITILSVCFFALGLFCNITILGVISWICIITSYFSTIFVALLNAQYNTKLRFDPTFNNNEFPSPTFFSKDKGNVSIIESNVFKITLKNVGDESWNSSHFQLHRHTFTCCAFKLPIFTLLPGQQITLIPETYDVESFNDECIRIPGFHCFGNVDRCKFEKTYIVDRRKQLFGKKEDGLCNSYDKIAEFLTGSDEQQWINRNVV